MLERRKTGAQSEGKEIQTDISLTLTLLKQTSSPPTLSPSLVEKGIITIIVIKQNASNPKPPSI